MVLWQKNIQVMHLLIMAIRNKKYLPQLMKILTTLLSVGIISIGFSTNSTSASTQKKSNLVPSGSASEIISAINNYRAQNGLSPLTPNALLGSLAQGQADYQASIQTVTHTGPGGTSPQDRAASAGYGGGNFFYLSEIIYGGYQSGVYDALSWWQNSSLHNGIMLASRYTEIGAGIAYSGDRAYYTAVLGGPTGSGSSISSGTNNNGSGEENSPNPTDLAFAVMPVQKATPQADGAIIHIVQQGQTIWTIEAVYELEPGTLREINEIPSYPYVFPGDELLIKPPFEIDGTPPPERTSAPDNTSQKTALGTPFSYSNQEEAVPTGTITFIKPTRVSSIDRQVPSEDFQPEETDVTNKYIIVGALLILVVVSLGSMFLRKPAPQSEPEDQN